MSQHTQKKAPPKRWVPKASTGIQGLDEIIGGGLPAGRPTLLCGDAGSGKTLMAMEFIVKGITLCNENGVYLTFEESKEDLYDNVASLGFDMDELDAQQRIFVREIDLEMQDMVEIGKYNLEGLFSQLAYAIDSIGAKRIVIDGIEALFSNFTQENILRKEVKRLFQWLKEKEVTAIITSGRGSMPGSITRHGIEKYISDCVIILNHRIENQIATRRLHVLKYRGSRHDTNEFPFLITSNGISVYPITSITMDHEVSSDRVSTGIDQLDQMLKGGHYRGSGVLISGTAGTGKSSLAAYFSKAVCEGGEKCVYFAFEESSRQIIRNMNSIGLNLQPFVDKGLLKIHAARPMLQGLEMHLLTMHDIVDTEKPGAVILDPISNLDSVGNLRDIKLMFIRVIDQLKQKGITALLTALTPGESVAEATEVGVSSIMDTWILLQHTQNHKKRERLLYIAKARGIGHSRQIYPFDMTDHGIEIKRTSEK